MLLENEEGGKPDGSCCHRAVRLRGYFRVKRPSTWTTTARPGDPCDCPEGLPCTCTIIREAHTWGFAPFRPHMILDFEI